MESNNHSKQLCGFKINGDLYGVPVLDVQEIIKPQTLTMVPLASRHIRGLINLRGQIVTTVSMRKLFGIDELYGKNHMNVIVRWGGALSSLTVDEICDVINVEEGSFEETPETLDQKMKPYVSGIHKLEDSLLIVLNLKKILSA